MLRVIILHLRLESASLDTGIYRIILGLVFMSLLRISRKLKSSYKVLTHQVVAISLKMFKVVSLKLLKCSGKTLQLRWLSIFSMPQVTEKISALLAMIIIQRVHQMATKFKIRWLNLQEEKLTSQLSRSMNNAML